jgi:hypothetical protein
VAATPPESCWSALLLRQLQAAVSATTHTQKTHRGRGKSQPTAVLWPAPPVALVCVRNGLRTTALGMHHSTASPRLLALGSSSSSSSSSQQHGTHERKAGEGTEGDAALQDSMHAAVAAVAMARYCPRSQLLPRSPTAQKSAALEAERRQGVSRTKSKDHRDLQLRAGTDSRREPVSASAPRSEVSQ